MMYGIYFVLTIAMFFQLFSENFTTAQRLQCFNLHFIPLNRIFQAQNPAN